MAVHAEVPPRDTCLSFKHDPFHSLAGVASFFFHVVDSHS